MTTRWPLLKASNWPPQVILDLPVSRCSAHEQPNPAQNWRHVSVTLTLRSCLLSLSARSHLFWTATDSAVGSIRWNFSNSASTFCCQLYRKLISEWISPSQLLKYLNPRTSLSMKHWFKHRGTVAVCVCGSDGVNGRIVQAWMSGYRQDETFLLFFWCRLDHTVIARWVW